jgi:glycosyltransferase involved in cell wall biosynthesis
LKRVLFVLETSGWSAQDRVRGSIYRETLQQCQIAVEYAGRYPAWPYRMEASRSKVVRYFVRFLSFIGFLRIVVWIARRWNDCLVVYRSRRFDCIHLIKTGTDSRFLIDGVRKFSRAKIVYDLGDSIWLKTAGNEKFANIEEIFSRVDGVTTDNDVALAYVKKFNPSVHLWPSISQVELFDKYRSFVKPSVSTGEIILGWVASPSSFFHLLAIFEPLERIFERHKNLRLRILGTGYQQELFPTFESVRYSILPVYSPEEMYREILAMDVGLFPMFDIQNAAVRGVNKALLYMAGEAAVICSPRGVCSEVIRDGENGFLADSKQEWLDKLERLVTEPDLRERFRKAGLETARGEYSLEACCQKLIAAYE